MKLFFEYLKQRRSGIILFLIFSIVFSVVFVLYNITFKAVLYPFLLCLAIGVVFFSSLIFFPSKRNMRNFAKSGISPPR